MSKKSLEFHIKSNDYFGTIATVLNLISQDLNKKVINKNHVKVLNSLSRDLMSLQSKYKIVKN